MENWYPKIFDDVKEFSPIKGDYLFVSELVTHELKGGIQSSRDYQSLLINPELIKYINPKEINHATDSSVHPIYDEDYEYKGRSSVFISNHEGLENVSPFVYSWESANNITFQPDPMFLQTYGLTPRLTEKTIHWDDLSRPLMDIVTLIPKSVYDFPNYSQSYVQIRKDYLQDYLKLTKKSLIQVYCETRILECNQELEGLLVEDGYYERTTKYNHFRINKISENKIFTEVTGYRQINLGDKVPFSKWDKKEKVFNWPGYTEPISRKNAKHFDYVFVSDEVLDIYEKDEKYEVYPSGGVGYMNQWSVSRASRVGRNHIQLELFKLYEGTPTDVIAHWNKFAVNKSAVDFDKENIVDKAERLVFTYIDFAECLSQLIFNYFETNLKTDELIRLDKKKLKYYGWYTEETIKPITHHLRHKLDKQDFLFRVKKLHHFLVENLVERKLRYIASDIFGIDLNKFKRNPDEVIRSIKLLNIILNYIRISEETGLNLNQDSAEINNRLLENELIEMELIKHLNAINNLRQLDSHKGGTKSDDKLTKALNIFGLEKNQVHDNYLDACETIYDKIELEFRELRKTTHNILYK